MMHTFLANNRDELIARCKGKVAQRPHRAATEEQLKNGVPMFLEQLRRTLEAEESDNALESLQISGASSSGSRRLSEVSVSAAAHGKQLLELGYSLNQVVHDYGDLCQAITELAFERDAPFAVPEFRTLNRCLDNAIADAVTKFSDERDSQQDAAAHERSGFLAHELRNHLSTAMLSFAALEEGKLPIGGATGAVLKRSHSALKDLIDRSLSDVQANRQGSASQAFSLASFIADAAVAAALDASAKGCSLSVPAVDPVLAVSADRGLLLAALANLLQNAFKFTEARTEVTLHAYSAGNMVFIDVADHCGGLTPGTNNELFKPFSQVGKDRSGLGLGLSIARKNVEADGGTLNVRDVPGTGCVFTISLARHEMRTTSISA